MRNAFLKNFSQEAEIFFYSAKSFLDFSQEFSFPVIEMANQNVEKHSVSEEIK